MFCELEKCQEVSTDSNSMKMLNRPVPTSGDISAKKNAPTKKVGQLYDVDSILTITQDVANGYLILLTGGTMMLPPSTKKENTSKAMSKIVSSRMRKKKRNRKRDDSQDKHEQFQQQAMGEELRLPRVEPSDVSSISCHGANVVPMKNVCSPEFENNLSLAFIALTDGNVVDACFGVGGCGRNGSTQAKNIIREAKNLLRNAGDSSESIKHLAVGAYGRSFDAVIEYRKNIAMKNRFGSCSKAKTIRKAAEENLSDAFVPLLEALELTP